MSRDKSGGARDRQVGEVLHLSHLAEGLSALLEGQLVPQPDGLLGEDRRGLRGSDRPAQRKSSLPRGHQGALRARQPDPGAGSPNDDGTPWPGPGGLHTPGEPGTRPGGPGTLCVPGCPLLCSEASPGRQTGPALSEDHTHWGGCATPSAPSQEDLVTGCLSISPRGKQAGRGDSAPAPPTTPQMAGQGLMHLRPPPAPGAPPPAPGAPPPASRARLPRPGPRLPLPETPAHTLWGLWSSSTCEMTAGGVRGLNAGSWELDAGCSLTLIDCGGWGDPACVSQSGLVGCSPSASSQAPRPRWQGPHASTLHTKGEPEP